MFKRFYSVEYTNLAEYMDIRYGQVLSEDDLDADKVFIVTWLPQVIDPNYENNKLGAVRECIARLGEADNEG